MKPKLEVIDGGGAVKLLPYHCATTRVVDDYVVLLGFVRELGIFIGNGADLPKDELEALGRRIVDLALAGLDGGAADMPS